MSGPIDLRPDHEKLVRDILAARLQPGVKVLAFGSRAKWTAKAHSDLDLALKGDAPLPGALLAELAEEFSESELPFKVDVVDWRAVGPALQEAIERDGVDLNVIRSRSAADFVEGKLGDVIQLKRGYDLPQQDRIHGDFPIVSSSGITGYNVKPMVRGPGVVTGRYGTLGQVFFLQRDYWPLNTTLYVRDFKGNDPRFVYYFLKSLDFYAYSDKAAVPGLNRNDLHLAPVRYPPIITQQRAIASILGALDDKIDLNRRMNETLEAMARAIFKDWFVDFGPTRAKIEGRPPYLAPDVWALFPDRLDEEGKPQGWEASTIGREVEVVGGSTPSTAEPRFWGGDMAWATPKDLSSLSAPVLLETERKITEAGVAQISSGLLPIDTVLLSSRAPIGYVAVAQVPTAINQGFIAMKCQRRVSSVHAWLWTLANLDAIHQKANGSTFQEISKSNFRPIPMTIASDAVLDEFERVARPLLDRIIANEKETRSLAATRDLLLPKLMSGELRVREAGKIVEAAV